MSEDPKRYTVEDIDRMRKAIWRRHAAARSVWSGCRISSMDAVEAENRRAADDAENQLRTFMLNGTRPEEIEATAAREEEVHDRKVKEMWAAEAAYQAAAAETHPAPPPTKSPARGRWWRA